MHLELTSWQLVWCVLIFIIGTGGNVVVITVILKGKKVVRSAPFNIYILALAWVDLIGSLLIIPNYLLSVSLDLRFANEHIGSLYCNVVSRYFFPFWLCLVSVYILVLISLERRRAVLQPFTILNRRRYHKTILILCAVIFMTLIIELPASFGLMYDRKKPTVGKFCSYSFGKNVNIAIFSLVFVVQYVVPCSIFITSFIQMKTRMAGLSQSLLKSMAAYPDHVKTEQQALKLWKQQKKTMNTMKIVIGAFFVCISPNEVLYALFHIFNITSITWISTPYQIGMLLKFSNYCVNPILYSFFSPRFQRHFIEVYPNLSQKWRSLRDSFKRGDEIPYENAI